MQPRSPHRFGLIASAALLSACFAHGAGWSTNIWPSQEHPRETYRQLSEAYTAAVERCRAALVSEPDAPAWYRSNRGNLIAIKSALKNAIEHYYDPYVMDCTATNGVAAVYFASNTNDNDTLIYDPVLSITSYLVACKIPTNYFDYTPYRCLTGLGPYTDDPNVAYPHGYTNTSTQAGGTNYPASRTTWYTTDYGWNQITSIVNGLVFMVGDNPSIVSTGTMIKFAISTNINTSWTDAKADSESSTNDAWSGDNFVEEGTYGQLQTFFEPDRYAAKLRTRQKRFTLSLTVTNYEHSVEWYFHTSRGVYVGAPTNLVYSNDGEGWVQDTFSFVEQSTPSTNTLHVSATYGDFVVNDWCAEPTTTAINQYKGMYWDGGGGPSLRAVVRWDGTNGFRFK